MQTSTSQYEYKMLQVPPSIRVNNSNNNAAAEYLQDVVRSTAVNGWEFYRVDSIGVVSEPGCLMSLLGQKSTSTSYYVVTFRKPRN
ncbi:MAG: DUF4177 domain-containing protein [Chloroflexota bacterium]